MHSPEPVSHLDYLKMTKKMRMGCTHTHIGGTPQGLSAHSSLCFFYWKCVTQLSLQNSEIHSFLPIVKLSNMKPSHQKQSSCLGCLVTIFFPWEVGDEFPLLPQCWNLNRNSHFLWSHIQIFISFTVPSWTLILILPSYPVYLIHTFTQTEPCASWGYQQCLIEQNNHLLCFS